MRKKITALLCALAMTAMIPSNVMASNNLENSSVPSDTETPVETTTPEATDSQESTGTQESTGAQETETTAAPTETKTESGAAGEITDAAEKEKIYTDAYKKMLDAEVFDVKVKYETVTGADKSEMTSEGTVMPKANQSYTKLKHEGGETETYIKDGKIYTLEPKVLEWQFRPMEIETKVAEKFLLNKEIVPLLKMERKEDGTVLISTVEPAKIQDLAVAAPIGSEIVPALEMPDSTAEIKMEINPEGYFSKMEIKMNLQNAAASMTEKMESNSYYEFSGFNTKKAIEFPKELETAKEIQEPLPGGPEVTNTTKAN